MLNMRLISSLKRAVGARTKLSTHICASSLTNNPVVCPPLSRGVVLLLQVCIQGIPWKYTEEDLGGLVAECGEVEKSEVMTSPDGRSKVRCQYGGFRHDTTVDG